MNNNRKTRNWHVHLSQSCTIGGEIFVSNRIKTDSFALQLFAEDFESRRNNDQFAD